MRKKANPKILKDIYNRLFRYFGPRNWWPGETPFEVIVGAILTQNTAWANVEKAIQNLKEEGLMLPEKLFHLRQERLASLIRPAGYFNIKSQRLKSFLAFLFSSYQGRLNKMFRSETVILREELLKVKGIGPETADSILLYAGGKLTFVVDAYTRRIFSRYGLIDGKASYHQIQTIFYQNLPHQVQLFNEYHALLVELGKTICRKKPNCPACPLKTECLKIF